MRHIPSIPAIISVLILLAQPIRSQWTQTPGPYGGKVNSLIAHTDRILAGTDGGLFLTTDNGSNWARWDVDSYPSEGPRALYSSGSILLAGFVSYGVYSSTDDGLHWTRSESLLYGGVYTFTSVGSTFFAGTRGGGVFLSADSGKFWTPVNTGLTNLNVNALATYGNHLCAGTDSGVFVSTDNGSNWTRASTGISPWRVVKALAFNGPVLFAGVENGRAYFSADFGGYWTQVVNGLICSHVYSFAVSGSGVFAATNMGVFFTANNGTNWTKVNTGISNVGINTLLYSGTNLFAGTDGGIFLTTNDGYSWTKANNGLLIGNVQAFGIPRSSTGEHIFAATYGSGIFSSPRDTISWTEANTGLTVPFIWDFIIDTAEGRNTLVACTGTGGIFISTDNGVSWSPSNTGLTDQSVTALFSDEQYIYAGGFAGRMHYSNNHGASWTPIPIGLTSYSIWSILRNGTYLYASSSSGLFRSANNGSSWSELNTGGSISIIYCFASATVPGGTIIYIGTDNGIYQTADNGNTWAFTGSGLAGKDIYSIVTDDTTLYAAASYGIYRTTVNGTEWSDVRTGLENISAVVLRIKDGHIYTGTSARGVWRCPLSELVVSVETPSGVQPAAISLEQNYPNPFNPTTTIRFSIQRPGFVTVKIFNTLGELIATLASEYMNAGTFSRAWNASGFASGVYYCRLEAGGLSITNKLLLLK